MAESKSAIIVVADGHHRHGGAPCSFLWFAAIQNIERKQGLAGLAPKGCLKRVRRSSAKLGRLARRKSNARVTGTNDGIDNFSGSRAKLAGLPELAQIPTQLAMVSQVGACERVLVQLP
jgi:hypothetical protein